MKLYETKANTGDGTYWTRFVTSRKEAGSLIRGKPEYRIAEVTVPDRLTAAEWIKLLEGDAPGMQELEMTPVDFIQKRKIVKEKTIERKEKASQPE